MTDRTSVFDLPTSRRRKADPALVGADERHLAAVAASLTHQIGELTQRLEARRREPGRAGTGALERDQEIHRLGARLRTLRRFGADLCLGRMVPLPIDGEGDGDGTAPAPIYLGRLGLTDPDGNRLLVDWRSPAAEPFFAATHGDPRGLASRRRYRWTHGRITDYWDEAFTDEVGDDVARAALEDTSAFIASLGASRSPRMRDVLATIAADQDAIVRAGADGALVVDGGPGTGKTVVALHRAAYLLHADPGLDERRGGVLVLGPHQPYLDYVADVLPALGEDGVRTATLRDLVLEGADAAPEADREVARLKGAAAMVGAIEPAVALYEEPPTQGREVATPWADVWLSPVDWVEAFAAPEPGTPHNEAREVVWAALCAILADKVADALGEGEEDGDEVPSVEAVRRALRLDDELTATFGRAWPLLGAPDLVADLWEVPAYLRRCAPWLSPAEVHALQREDPRAWTVADLPLLDAARRRLGDPEAARRRRREAAALAAERAYRADVVADLVAADDSELRVMSMLRGDDLQNALDADADGDPRDRGRLAGPFAHVVVDEAQELTDAEWQMVLARCPSRSLTIVGDRAQARSGFSESWEERLRRVGLHRIDRASLRVNYRTPSEVMAAAEPVIRAALPDANVPTSVRDSGVPVTYGRPADLDDVLARWRAEAEEGTACVIGAPGFAGDERVRSLTPSLAKGLEFDLVVLVEPDRFGEGDGGVAGAVDRYVAMTRATQRLVVLTG
ncbi:AAA family ATPase [Serinibacter arcticus]|uniref:AAA family ATPase n=1 Tax=Serinibacter arcticus TaxID=1655435 RepID=A0A2U1ZVU4_9MICO|nr:RNA polymerase recycling motor ATPase HelR [Serinibacter arcticus]PWD51063.1 AAA family ATPase [Serinibacter arcticus]